MISEQKNKVRDLTEAENLATKGYPDVGQMDAYYYSFEATGVPAIDAILGAVGSAGKGYHHTDDWSTILGWDEYAYSYIDRIQGAALLAAKEFAALSRPAPAAPPTDALEAIRARHEACRTWRIGDISWVSQAGLDANIDRATLLARDERREAELAAVTAERNRAQNACEQMGARISRLICALDEMVQAFDEHVALPEPACCCHLAPPCNDCVENDFARNALASAREILQEKGQ